MTCDERKEKMREMYSKGMNYSEIGKEFGISRQRVYQLIGGEYRNRFNGIKPENCVYDAIREFLIANRISITELSRRVFGCNEPRCRECVDRLLKGQDTVHKSVMDKILVITGLTYEQAFCKGDINEKM